MRKSIPGLMVIITMTLLNFGCRAGPAKPAGFVNEKMMAADPTLPFQKVWVKPGFDRFHYTKIYVAPIDTSHLLTESSWQKGERKDQITADIGTLARYSEKAIKTAFEKDPKHHFTVVDKPTNDPNELICEFALVEVVPSKVVLNALEYAPFFVGTTITVVRTLAQDVSTAAFEARFRDAHTGQVVVQLADREQEQMAIVTVRGLTWYSHCQFIISHWADQFVKMMNQKPGEVIKPTDTFTLQPW